MYYIGIDLGTSAMKLLLTDENGHIYNTVSKGYPLEFPKDGWCEQNAQDWKKALFEGLPELLNGFDASCVKGIGCGGQMHGLVALDENDEPIRPVILWNDSRTVKEVDKLNYETGKKRLSEWTANIAFAGFTAPKLLWMKKNEPLNFAKISKIMLPKDYINYILTGVHSCDHSDASGTLLYCVEKKCWSKQMLDICDVSEAQMPTLFESYECIGKLKTEVAMRLGIPDTVKVCAGASDNAAAAIGMGVVGDGGCNISLGTSGTVFISSKNFSVDKNNSLHSFAHADGGYHLLGCILSAASCNKWLTEDIFKSHDYSYEEKHITYDKLGENRVFFLPYLMGERSPINDPNARGCFIGMTMNTSRTDLAQAVLEGVAFAIRDNLEVARNLGIEIKSSRICGGGARSSLWKQIISNVLNIELESSETEQGPAMGGAMLAMICCGEYPDAQAVCTKMMSVSSVVKPTPELSAKYETRYQQFKKIYPALKNIFEKI